MFFLPSRMGSKVSHLKIQKNNVFTREGVSGPTPITWLLRPLVVTLLQLNLMENSPSAPSANPTEGSISQPSLDPLDPLAPGLHYERQYCAHTGGPALDVVPIGVEPSSITP